MTTRGLIQIYNVRQQNQKRRELIANIYVHGDMYEDGVMCNVFQYLEKKALVNGYQPDKMFMQVNGMDDLASVIITYLKTVYTETMKKFGYETGDAVPIAAGYVYLFPANIKLNETDVSYIYKLLPPTDYEERGFKYGLGAPLFTLRVMAYKYDWTEENAKPKLFFRGTADKYVQKYCVDKSKIRETT